MKEDFDDYDALTLRQCYKCAAITGILANPSWNAVAIGQAGVSDIDAMKLVADIAGAYASFLVGEDRANAEKQEKSK